MQSGDGKNHVTDLASASLAGVRPVAEPFRNLHFHRWHVLEGLRRTASRNLRSLNSVTERVERGLDSVAVRSRSSEQLVRLIQEQTLRDQGLPSTPEHRLLLAAATFLPVRLYCALLFAEVECLRKTDTRPSYVTESEVTATFEAHTKLIGRLEPFRDLLLHPQAATAMADEELLEGGLVAEILLLQESVDTLIERARHRVRGEVESILEQLPDAQAQLCRWLHLEECRAHPLLGADDHGRIGLDAAYQAVNVDLNQAAVERLIDGPDQLRHKVFTIASWLTDTSEIWIQMGLRELETPQPGIDLRLVAGLLGPMNSSPVELDGREASHLSAHWQGYAQWLFTACVLLNESATLGKRITLASTEQNDREPLYYAALRELPAIERVRIASLGRVSTALLVPLLDSYTRVRRDNAAVAIPALEAVVADPESLALQREFRNSIFHVQRAPGDAEWLDRTYIDAPPTVGAFADLYQGCAEFLSWFAPDKPLSELSRH